jgi:hypothetical protein
MTQKKSKTLVASAVSLALSSMMLSAGLNAGTIVGAYVPGVGDIYTTGVGDPTTSGSWNLTDVSVFGVTDGVVTATEFTDVMLADGIDNLINTQGFGTTYDSFASYIYAPGTTTLMGKLTGKDYPVGGPTGVKAINNDNAVSVGKPTNCIIGTSFLEGAYLGTTAVPGTPDPVICSSPFQSHKRFKIAMQPTTIVTDTAGTKGEPIDLVFNVADDTTGLRAYQVFSKINNYTGKRLSGYMLQIGVGTGAGFQTASELGIADRLQLTADPAIFEDGLATFSHGLFGEADKHFATDGFFDNEAAGYAATTGCSTATVLTPVACNGTDTDTVYSTGPLNAATSYYATYFRDWLPQELAPKGLFHDADGDPTTDPILKAWWNGSAWVAPNDVGTYDNKGTPSTADDTFVTDDDPSIFVAVSTTDLNTWAADPAYYVDIIEDVLNLGLNYVVNVGDAIGSSTITVRIIPIAGDQTQASPWTANSPAVGDLVPVSTTTPTTTTSGGGGGCTIGSNGRFDPTLPALMLAGMGLLGWRRFRNGK